MSSIVIRPEDGQPDSLKALLAAVTKLAGNEPVTVGSGGVVVSRAVAKKYLNAKTTDTSANTNGYTVDNTRAPLVTQRTVDPVPYPDPDPARPVGGLTPEGDFPGGYPGRTPADAPADDAPAPADDADDSGTAEPDPSTPAKKAAAPKSTAAAQQRASRSTARSNP